MSKIKLNPEQISLLINDLFQLKPPAFFDGQLSQTQGVSDSATAAKVTEAFPHIVQKIADEIANLREMTDDQYADIVYRAIDDCLKEKGFEQIGNYKFEYSIILNSAYEKIFELGQQSSLVDPSDVEFSLHQLATLNGDLRRIFFDDLKYVFHKTELESSPVVDEVAYSMAMHKKYGAFNIGVTVKDMHEYAKTVIEDLSLLEQFEGAVEKVFEFHSNLNNLSLTNAGLRKFKASLIDKDVLNKTWQDANLLGPLPVSMKDGIKYALKQLSLALDEGSLGYKDVIEKARWNQVLLEDEQDAATGAQIYETVVHSAFVDALVEPYPRIAIQAQQKR